MTHVQTIFFDWGGVIADDPGDDFLGALLQRLGANDEQVQEIFDSYLLDFMKGKITETIFWDQLRTYYGLTIHDTISEEFRAWRGLVTNTAVLALAEKAHASGVQTALLSNIIEPTYTVIAEAGYFSGFDAVIASCKVGYAKPEQQIYDIALRTMNAKPEESLFIDDKQRNLDPAATMGFHTILATNPAQIIADVSAYLQDV